MGQCVAHSLSEAIGEMIRRVLDNYICKGQTHYDVGDE